jgi:alginate O-acetyltransferase complex protein AlgI
MIFASFEFLFLFLPLFFAGYFLTPARWRNVPILLFSWAFYAWWRVDFLALLVAVTLFTYTVARFMEFVGPRGPAGHRLMVAGLIGNLAVLGYFKYANFGVATFNQLIGAVGAKPMGWTEIVLPIGLSFYVLQSVSYLVDIYRGTVPVSRSFLNYAAYKAIFAQLIAGPIVRYAEIADELKHRHHSLAQFGAGARIFMIGFAMKTALADTLSPLVEAVFTLVHPTLVDSWTGAVAYTLQLYFDFAGYSLMAIGLARMIGFHFPQNFNNPYLSVSIQDFWQRWHMTLSRFLRDYLYIPFGGNRKGARRTYVNLMMVMAIGGLWHGSSWNFIIWGVWHGAMLALHRWWSRRPGYRPMHPVLGNALTMLGVTLGWVVFRAKDFADTAAMFAGMLGLHGVAMSDQLAWQATPDRMWFIPIAAALIYWPLLLERLGRPRFGFLGHTLAPLAGFVLAMVLLYSRDAVPFLYFQF